MTPQIIEPTAENMNALLDAVRALTLAFTRQLPADKQQDLRNDLVRLSREAGAQNKPLLEALLTDFHMVVGTASGAVQSTP